MNNHHSHHSQRYTATKRLSLMSACINFFLAFLKLMAGYFSHSQALIADGFHSLSDILSDALVLTAATMGKRIPDKEHPYGHQRIETIAAIILALLMFSAGASILYANIRHLMTSNIIQIHSIPVILIAIISITIYLFLSYYNYTIGFRIHSNLLISNSRHNLSDAYSSAIVMVSGIAAFFHWSYFDSIGAIIIALLIIKMGSGILWNSLQELIDAGVDQETLEKMLACIQNINGVGSIHQLRTRLHGGTIFVDVHVIVEPFISVSEGHHIGEQVHLKLMQNFPKIIDVVVHIDPEDDEKNRPCIHLPSRSEILQQFAIAAKNLPSYQNIQKIGIHYYDGEIYLDVFLPYSKDEKNLPFLNHQYQSLTSSLQEVAKITLYFSINDYV